MAVGFWQDYPRTHRFLRYGQSIADEGFRIGTIRLDT
jgi:hypothetical protein